MDFDFTDDLANSEDMSIRWGVAKKTQDPQILQKLSQDGVNLVRALVATNEKTPIPILEKLFFDEKIVRDGLSGNPSTPPKYLNLLCDDPDKMVRLRVSQNRSTPIASIKKLANDADSSVCKAAQKRIADANE